MTRVADRRSRRDGSWLSLAAAAVLVVFCAAYLPDVGHGFLKDDFRWIRESRVSGPGDLLGLFTSNVGFYRPLVSVSFAADYALWGLDPFGYGTTNVLLLLADVALLVLLARRLGLTAGAAVLTGAVFLLNLHAVNMALLWTSGRTSLLALLCALGTVHAVLSARYLIAGLLCLCALLSKEEVIALPFALTLFVWLEGGRWRRLWPLWAAVAVYFVLRAPTGALTPGTAPDYYRFALEPALLLRNVAEYADRAGTIAAAVGLLLLGLTPRPWPAFCDGERRALRLAALWIPAMFVATVALPLRSSLYALAPSAGAALVAGAIASRLARTNPYRMARATVALLLVAALLVPVYRARNDRWVSASLLGSEVMSTIRASTSSLPTAGRVVLVDDPAADPNLVQVFDALFPDALALFAGPAWTGSLVDSPSAVPDDRQVTTIVYRLRDGTLEPVSVTPPARTRD